MAKRFLIFLILIVPLWAACGRETGEETTPTPFGGDATAFSLVIDSSAKPTPVTLTELTESPELFMNQYIAVTGNYAPRPLLVCNGEAHPGPASWALRESEEIMIPVGGFDSEVRSLLPKGTTMTVNGYWRFWEGPIGCGKQAIGQQMWYLKVTELVSPEFLAQGGLIPSQNSTVDPTLTELPPDDAEDTAVPGTATIITTTVPITSTEPGFPTDNPTPTREALETATAVISVPTPSITQTTTPDLVLSATPQTPTGSTPSVTPSSNGSSTPTTATTPGASTPTPPATGSYTVIDLGDTVNPDDGIYGYETLGAWEKHNWSLAVDTSDKVTISVIGNSNMNLSLVVFDEIDNELANQNNVPAGQVERITNLTIDPNETYIIQVFEANGVAGDYFLTIEGNDAATNISSRGILNYGDNKSDAMLEGDYHFWYFYAEAGDVVDITTTADNDGLLLISLYDSQNNVVQDETGDFIEYVEEEVTGLIIPGTGLYLITLEEFAFEATNYTISLVKH